MNVIVEPPYAGVSVHLTPSIWDGVSCSGKSTSSSCESARATACHSQVVPCQRLSKTDSGRSKRSAGVWNTIVLNCREYLEFGASDPPRPPPTTHLGSLDPGRSSGARGSLDPPRSPRVPGPSPGNPWTLLGIPRTPGPALALPEWTSRTFGRLDLWTRIPPGSPETRTPSNPIIQWIYISHNSYLAPYLIPIGLGLSYLLPPAPVECATPRVFYCLSHSRKLDPIS